MIKCDIAHYLKLFEFKNNKLADKMHLYCLLVSKQKETKVNKSEQIEGMIHNIKVRKSRESQENKWASRWF